MTTTDYKYNNQEVSYEILSNGYEIYLSGRLWISQKEPYIPNPSLSYEENCLNQIKETCTAVSKDETELEQLKTTNMQLESQISELDKTCSMLLLQIAQYHNEEMSSSTTDTTTTK
jgi:hypothetical protein